MKAIYINIDPYLQAVADWLNAGKPGTVPSFDPLPVAVTIPLGESAGIFFVGGGDKLDDPGNDPGTVTIGEASITFWTLADDGIPETAVATNVVPGLSALAPSTKYWLEAVTGDTSFSVFIVDSDDDEINVTIPVLVHRETASGPVDLVDFAPPATLTAAAINTALGGSGAAEGQPLEGVNLGGTILVDNSTRVKYRDDPDPGTLALIANGPDGYTALCTTDPGS